MNYTETAPIKDMDAVNRILSIEGRDGFLFAVALHTALRVGEYVAVKWKYFVCESGPLSQYVYHIEKKRGGKGSKRLIFYPPYLISRAWSFYIESGRPSLDEYVFVSKKGRLGNGHITSRTVNDLIKKRFEEVGVVTRNPSSHTFRKTMARRFWENNGLEATMKLLGHESEKDTLKYIGIDEDEMRAAINKFNY